VIKSLRRCRCIIGWKGTHKFGIKLSKTVEEVLKIDRKMGTDFWQKAIEKKLKNVKQMNTQQWRHLTTSLQCKCCWTAGARRCLVW
jgi:hypothetical protein